MADQIIIGVDKDGNPTGEYFPKEEGHTGEGKRHLAVTVVLYNDTGEVLIQLRKHKVFDRVWDLAPSTHQLHKPSGKDETDEQAALRALKREYGITKIKLKTIGGFNYFAQYGELCENEYDKLLIGEYNGEVILNKEIAYDCRWMEKEEFFEDIAGNPKRYTPWAVKAAEILKEIDF
jgi:isopentenyl-diphosphate Delta-isomerase